MTTQTQTLADWLLACIAADEAMAREVRPDEAPEARDVAVIGAVHDGAELTCTISSGRILAECYAKRQMIADLLSEKHEVVEDGWYTCAAATEDRDGGECIDDGRQGGECDCGRDTRIGRHLRWLAFPYADRPGYLTEWRPM